MLKIVTSPNPALSQKAKPVQIKSGLVTKIDKSVLLLIEDMKQTLAVTKDPEGVGLAAPQAGKSLQIFIIKPSPKSPMLTFINPEIIARNYAEPFDKSSTPRSLRLEELRASSKLRRKNQLKSASRSTPISKASKKLEGCLSLPSTWGEVKRAHIIVVKYFDENGTLHKRTFRGFSATIIQHECDHLNGTLFPKRVLEQNGTLYKSHKNENGQDEFEEIEL